MPIQKKRVSPRQKMINLMYVVLMAMLALNVSSDVLNGFSLVSQGLNRSTANASRTNKTILDQFEAQMIETEIDVERIRAERRRNTTFAASAAQLGARSKVQGARGMSGQNVFSCPSPLAPCSIIVDTERVPARPFSLTRIIDPYPFVPSGKRLDERCQEIFDIQTEGLSKRIQHTGAQTVVLGISGGLDSTLALLVEWWASQCLASARQTAPTPMPSTS